MISENISPIPNVILCSSFSPRQLILSKPGISIIRSIEDGSEHAVKVTFY
jgi:hypothetical protein